MTKNNSTLGPKKTSTIISEGQDKPLAPTSRHYVNNAEFFEALKERKEKREKNPEQEVPVSNYIADCILKIATNMGKKRNFMSKKYEIMKEDMIMDAVTNCIKYVDNFDPEKSSNPFSYFTQICYFAFIGRIRQEDAHKYIRYKSILESSAMEDFADLETLDEDSSAVDGANGEFSNEFIEDFVRNYEEKHNINAKKQARGRKKHNVGGALDAFKTTGNEEE